MNGRIPQDHIVRYVEQFCPPIPQGFQREHQFRPSPDGKICHFTLTDTQLPTALPEGVARARLRQREHTALQSGFAIWGCTISADITVPAGKPKGLAYAIFVNFVLDRTRQIPTVRAGPSLPGTAPFSAALPQNGLLFLMLTDVEVDDDVLGPSTSFRVSFFVYGSVTLVDILSASRMWRPMPNTNFARWAASVASTAGNPRGSANYRVIPQLEAIVDLCSPNPGRPSTPTTSVRDGAAAGARPRGGVANANDELPDPEQSWLLYECRIVYMEEPRLARHTPMGGSTTVNSGPDVGGRLPALLDDEDGIIGTVKTSKPDLLPEVRSCAPKIKLVGKASRLGYPVSIPAVVSIGGQPAVKSHVEYAEEVLLSRYGGLAIYGARWSVVYELAAPPTQSIEVPANPVLRLDGGEPGHGGGKPTK